MSIDNHEFINTDIQLNKYQRIFDTVIEQMKAKFESDILNLSDNLDKDLDNDEPPPLIIRKPTFDGSVFEQIVIINKRLDKLENQGVRAIKLLFKIAGVVYLGAVLSMPEVRTSLYATIIATSVLISVLYCSIMN